MPFIRFRVAVFALVVTAIAGTPAFAGDWHFGASAACSDCHTQHNSAGGQPMRTDRTTTPAAALLLRETPLDLCLSCHDGSNGAAPDVIAPVSYVDESAAGSFPSTGGTPLPNAHHLNNPTPEVPPGGTTPMVLTCTTCHDPHGNGNYRNLRPDPSRPEVSSGSVVVLQTHSANGTNPAQVYVASNVIYKSGVSAWCGKCHGTPGAGDHPVDRPIFGAPWASFTTWTSVTLPRVPVHSPTDNAIPSTDDQVMCLSCHKAHGSANPSTLIYADNTSMTSTCEECHNQ
jgi:predicted CXXCH cytochrome family protein